MNSRNFKILAVVAVLALAGAWAAFAGPDTSVAREVPATSDIQRYFAAHGVDQTLDNMVLAALKNDLDPYGDSWATVSMVLGDYTFTLSSGGGDEQALKVVNSSQGAMNSNG